MELKYSEEAKILVSQLTNFDKADFEKWFFENMAAGSRNIFEYIFQKERQKLKEVK